MTTLKPSWRREPLWNCPLCKGKGEIFWQLYTSVPPELVVVGRKKPKPPKKKGALKLAESKLSKARRESWMEHAAHYDYHCPCVTMRRIDYAQLKRTAASMNRIKHNKKIREYTLNDSLDDMFR